MKEVQEEVSERALRFMFKIPRVTAEMLFAALRSLLRYMEKQEPVGNQKLQKLMEGGRTLSSHEITSLQSQDVKQDMEVFDKLCRKYGVGYSTIKLTGAPGYNVFFRTNSAAQVKIVLEEFAKYKFARGYTPNDNTAVVEQNVDKQNPLEGEILENTGLAIKEKGKQSKANDLIYTDNPIAVYKESVYSKLSRAINSTRQNDALRAESIGMGMLKPTITRGRN